MLRKLLPRPNPKTKMLSRRRSRRQQQQQQLVGASARTTTMVGAGVVSFTGTVRCSNLLLLLLVVCFCCCHPCSSWTYSSSSVVVQQRRVCRSGRPCYYNHQQQQQQEEDDRVGFRSSSSTYLSAAATDSSEDDEVDLEYLKRELLSYLDKRKEVGADEIAKAEVGKNIGGTRGNPVLEYVSFAPNKGFTIDAAPDIFDYSELQKYGFANLATPIMKAGGRLAMYDLLGMEKPVTKKKKRKSAPKIVIDRTGENDNARYSGLKVGLLGDEDAMATALEEAQRKAKEGESLRPKLLEEDYEQPFADKRNVGPKQEGYWTAERLDEWGERRGKSLAEMQRQRQETLVSDASESMDIELPQRVYSLVTALAVAIGFGKATPTFLSQSLSLFPSPQDGQLLEILDVLKAPATALVLASVGSCIYCSLQAPGKKRNPVIWAVKGLLGGPITVRQIREAPELFTGREMQDPERVQDSN